METTKKIKLLAASWNKIIKNEKESLNLSELDFSALSSWLVDCFESYEHIYSKYLERIKKANPDDYDLIHDSIVEISQHLGHIKNHITDAEKGFSELLRVLATKAEKREK